jgi:hypothetical protein
VVELLIALGPVLLVILKSYLSGRYSVEGKKKRDDYERDKEIANKDHAAKSKRLSDLVDRV